MRKPVVDYREFRFVNINEPRFRHLWLLLGWITYFTSYFFTENLIPEERCHVIHCTLDDIIPFREEFVIFYVYWYFLVLGTLLYFLLYDIKSFCRVQVFIIVTQVLATITYIVYPSIQHLRPEVFPRQNALSALLGLIYDFDTPTGICPSLHVTYAAGVLAGWMLYKKSSLLWKGFMILSFILICLSILFVKQHSAVDILAAVPVCIVADLIADRAIKMGAA